MQNLYIYLSKREWVKNWVDGGAVPLYKTTKYKAMERSGIYTPDENFQRDLKGVNDEEFSSSISFKNVGRATIEKLVISGKIGKYEHYHEEALVLCLSTILSFYVGHRLGEKKACIKVLDYSKLKRVLYKQIGIKGRDGMCAYTTTQNRNHFLKSNADSWMAEYRIIWPGVEAQEVQIPKGLCEEVYF